MFGDSPAVPAAAPSGNYIQPTLNHGLLIWWAFFWRNLLISFCVGVLLGVGLVALARYIPLTTRRYVVAYSGYVIEYFVAIFVIYFIVRKKFRAFRIILTQQDGDSVKLLEPTFGRTFRIWWTYTWR
ncbi:MAG: hypothetical protein ACRD4Y_08515 [Candidatus Acidiferrales bacterium]